MRRCDCAIITGDGSSPHTRASGNADANHVSDPDPVGLNPARALRMALSDACVDAAEIGYVNAHGTSIPAGDAAETRVLKLALGEEKAYATPVSSTKGATGHTLGASGALGAVFTVLALQRGVLPPTINQTSTDPVCDLDYIAHSPREKQVEVAISNFSGSVATTPPSYFEGSPKQTSPRLQGRGDIDRQRPEPVATRCSVVAGAVIGCLVSLGGTQVYSAIATV